MWSSLRKGACNIGIHRRHVLLRSRSLQTSHIGAVLRVRTIPREWPHTIGWVRCWSSVSSDQNQTEDDEKREQEEVESIMRKILAQSKKKDEGGKREGSGLVDMITDVNRTYYPGQEFKATSQDMVFRAMAGNTLITALKLMAYLKTGSSAMLSEAIHSLVDTGNQGLLILGLRQASFQPDKKHQYGYGRAAYFCWEVWTVLGMSFCIDGYVLQRCLGELMQTKPKGVSLYQHIKDIKDPFMLAVVLEDSAACTGVFIALAGIGASYVTGNPVWDSAASIGIGCLLGGVAVSLIRMNQRFLLGQSVDPEIEQGIKALLLSRPSIDNSELPVILAWYAEDVTRLVEKEVQEVEVAIR
ncbi:hypothetical protein DYB32_008022 [Aphanomyces invadans]|uniref:Cation efflux protein transmembrane domain-containing protein n=1 Tax=Aphanomyces invadans TaxID=157072 RepID=A0A418AZD5_9STRA|nr:hypothetical protein DYB32_008022 [Aphanomyces invadans]